MSLWMMDKVKTQLYDLQEKGISKVQTIAVDFDGTITEENLFPEISKFKPFAVEALKIFQALGGSVILWTCREGVYLKDALAALEIAGFMPDAVNENIVNFGNPTRKVYADLYIDDRGLGCPLNWFVLNGVLCILSLRRNLERDEEK